ncbi:MAG: twin-arginine translocation signal domain-containing protein [Verrucomicrobia bacterium]|nr:twin-arginine translocation signal domain-containing protein [Verrucomicrobiota bacterium]
MKNSSCFSRRDFLKQSATAALVLPLVARVQASERTTAIDIGSRRELFVDDFLIEKLAGKAELRLHHPVSQEIALVHDAPWEGTGSGYHSIFKDGNLYRMYYKAWHLDVQPPGKVRTDAHPLFCCYAESDDGIHWRKPELGLHEFNGSKKNNIVMVPGKAGSAVADPGHPAVFKDENPNAPPDARYKAIIRSSKPRGLLTFKSPDGIHWSPMSDGPVIIEGAFDSQNLAFWDPMRREYRAYWRIFTNKVRAIRTATSKDFLKWGPHADLTYVDSPSEHLYTNQIKPYHRAPHIFIGFPARYVERGWSDSMRALPELEHRELRAKASLRYGTAITEGLLMASRDGVKFKRWNDAFLRPGIERPGTWNYGHQYIGWHIVETKSALEGAPNELSLYASESYWTGTSSELRRYTLRLDGFVSVNAPMTGGELITKPLTFTGSKLTLNFATSAAGEIRVEIQDVDGKPFPGFALDDCKPIFGDSVERALPFDVSSLAGKPVRLRFVLKDADLYAIRFVE